MQRMSIRKFKRELQTKIATLTPGERHEHFDVTVFHDLLPELRIQLNTPIVQNEVRTPVCCADDLRKNHLEYYWIKSINFDLQCVDVVGLEPGSPRRTFYLDAVALIPLDIVPGIIKLKLLEEDKLKKMLSDKKQIKIQQAAEQTAKIEQLVKEVKGE